LLSEQGDEHSIATKTNNEQHPNFSFCQDDDGIYPIDLIWRLQEKTSQRSARDAQDPQAKLAHRRIISYQ